MPADTAVEDRPEPFDPMCKRKASEIPQVVASAEGEGYESAAAWVRVEEGTYNHATNHFLCDECYIRAGLPSSPTGWKCP